MPSDALPSGPRAVFFCRAEHVEAVHSVAACVGDASGKVQYAIGDIGAPLPIHSLWAPLIVAAAICAGAKTVFGLTSPEIAVMAGSHSGEPHHVMALRSALRKAAVREASIVCLARFPRDPDARHVLEITGEPPSRLHNSCSGKHVSAAILGRLLGANVEDYTSDANRSQTYAFAFADRLLDGRSRGRRIRGNCGMSAPVASLRSVASAYARLATLNNVDDGDARGLQAVRDAMIAYPHYVGGTQQFDTGLMRAMERRLIARTAAEGLHANADIGSGAGLAVKIIDGSARAVAPTVVTLMEELGSFLDVPYEIRSNLTPMFVRDQHGTPAGRIRVSLPNT